MASTRADDVANELRSLLAEHGVPGVSVAWGTPDGIETAVAGTVNAATGYPVLPSTHFLVGSITKTFTAVTVMRLVEQGKLDLDAPIRRYLPDLRFAAPDTDAADVITLRLLLSHQSGVPSDNFEDFGRGDDCLARFAADLGRVNLAHQPRAFHSYSNGGFSLIGRIIEAGSGMVFDRALRTLVLTPLGLDSAGLLPEEVMHQSVAVGHDVASSPDGSALATPHRWPALRAIGPEGMMVISPEALARYGLAIADPAASGILRPETVAEMLRPQVEVPERIAGEPASWALGWKRPGWTDGAVAGHTGSIASSLAALAVDLDAHAVITVAVNAATGGASAIRTAAQRLAAEALGSRTLLPPSQPPAVPASVADLTPYTGVYGQLNSEYTVRLEGGRLLATAVLGQCLIDDGAVGFTDAPLTPLGDDRFVVEAPDGAIRVLFHARRAGERPEALYTGASAVFRLA